MKDCRRPLGEGEEGMHDSKHEPQCRHVSSDASRARHRAHDTLRLERGRRFRALRSATFPLSSFDSEGCPLRGKRKNQHDVWKVEERIHNYLIRSCRLRGRITERKRVEDPDLSALIPPLPTRQEQREVVQSVDRSTLSAFQHHRLRGTSCWGSTVIPGGRQ